MGGGAFKRATAAGEPSLSTPRLAPDDYMRLKTLVMEKLRAYFPDTRIACLTESPEKTDYGDIDLIIAYDGLVDFGSIANHVGAKGLICHSQQTCALAVAIDGSSVGSTVVVYHHVNDNKASGVKPATTATGVEYAQIDVEIVPTHLMDWHLFYGSYGDMAGLLGHIVTNLGFTVSDTGFHLRMKELDESKSLIYQRFADRDGMVLLSHDSSQVMSFLGLDVNRYTEGFKSLNELYEWLGSCHLLCVDAIKIKRNNSHERNRENKRTVFSGFFIEWLPTHLSSQSHDEIGSSDLAVLDKDRPAERCQGTSDIVEEMNSERRWSGLAAKREQLLQTAISFFGKSDEYEDKHNHFVRQVDNATAAHLLKPMVERGSHKKDKLLIEIMRAFRRYVGVVDDGSSISVLQKPHDDQDSELHKLLGDTKDCLKDDAMVEVWVSEHWEELRASERLRVKSAAEQRCASEAAET